MYWQSGKTFLHKNMRDFVREERAFVVSLEFILVLPIMLVVFIGGAEYYNYARVIGKVVTTSAAVTEYLAFNPNIGLAQRITLVAIAASSMAPYPTRAAPQPGRQAPGNVNVVGLQLSAIFFTNVRGEGFTVSGVLEGRTGPGRFADEEFVPTLINGQRRPLVGSGVVVPCGRYSVATLSALIPGEILALIPPREDLIYTRLQYSYETLFSPDLMIVVPNRRGSSNFQLTERLRNQENNFYTITNFARPVNPLGIIRGCWRQEREPCTLSRQGALEPEGMVGCRRTDGTRRIGPLLF